MYVFTWWNCKKKKKLIINKFYQIILSRWKDGKTKWQNDGKTKWQNDGKTEWQNDRKTLFICSKKLANSFCAVHSNITICTLADSSHALAISWTLFPVSNPGQRYLSQTTGLKALQFTSFQPPFQGLNITISTHFSFPPDGSPEAHFL